MKKVKLITLSVCMFSLFFCKGQPTNPVDISKRIGETITVCGIVKDVQATDNSGSTLVTINNSEASFVLITDKVKKHLDYSLSGLKGQNICFAGKIKSYKDKTVIMILKESDIFKSNTKE
jgi:hypothetical protein